MIGLIKGLLGDVIGIVLVVLAVILFSFFDPFGWFNPGAKLKGTSLMVREVKLIGELISAEYYGEAITSWATARRGNRMEIDSPVIVDIYEDLGESMEDIYEKESDRKDKFLDLSKWKKGKVWRKYKRDHRDQFKGIPLYSYMYKELVTSSKEKDFIYKMFHAVNDDMDQNDDIEFSEIQNISKDYEKTILSKNRKERKKDVIAIGRGIVRAGVDLSGVTEFDMLLDEERKTLYIRNVEPKIISTEMNPWFIPERGVKGFEILRLRGKVNTDNIKSVKSNLKKQLLDQAIAREIVSQAKTNAEEALAGFFGLLDPKIEKVRFLYQPLDLIQWQIDSNKVFLPEQAYFLFRSLYDYQKQSISPQDSDTLKSLIAKMNKKCVALAFRHKETNQIIEIDTIFRKIDIHNIVALNRYYNFQTLLPDSSLVKFSKIFWSINEYDSLITKKRLHNIRELFREGGLEKETSLCCERAREPSKKCSPP